LSCVCDILSRLPIIHLSYTALYYSVSILTTQDSAPLRSRAIRRLVVEMVVVLLARVVFVFLSSRASRRSSHPPQTRQATGKAAKVRTKVATENLGAAMESRSSCISASGEAGPPQRVDKLQVRHHNVVCGN